MDLNNPAMYLFLFYLAVIVAGGLLAAISASLIRALAGLVLTFFGVAGLYILMAAPLPALMQILIYVGAVVIIIFYAIMASQGAEEGQPERRRLLWLIPAALAGLLPAGLLAWLCITDAPPPLLAEPAEVPVERLGHDLMNTYFLAFELMAGVLFVAMIGALTLCRRPKTGAESKVSPPRNPEEDKT